MTRVIAVKATEGYFQGELYIGPVVPLPKVAMTEAKSDNGEVVVGHSETGHHHVARGARLFETDNPLVAYLVAERASSFDLVHLRDFDQHPTLRFLGNGNADEGRKVVRQREMSPAGWVRAAD